MVAATATPGPGRAAGNGSTASSPRSVGTAGSPARAAAAHGKLAAPRM